MKGGKVGILKKLKSLFKKEEVKEEPKVEEKPVEPDREVLANCFLCQEPIYVDERCREFNNSKVHKRCSKKAIKAMYNGQKIEDIS